MAEPPFFVDRRVAWLEVLPSIDGTAIKFLELLIAGQHREKSCPYCVHREMLLQMIAKRSLYREYQCFPAFYWKPHTANR